MDAHRKTMECQGPCLPHCCPPHVVILGYAAFAYALACIGYLALTRNIGTPFLDSLTDEQRAIKRASATVRGRAFVTAGLVSVVILSVCRPFRGTR